MGIQPKIFQENMHRCDTTDCDAPVEILVTQHKIPETQISKCFKMSEIFSSMFVFRLIIIGRNSHWLQKKHSGMSY